jgi:hypothetical protein
MNLQQSYISSIIMKNDLGMRCFERILGVCALRAHSLARIETFSGKAEMSNLAWMPRFWLIFLGTHSYGFSCA